LEADRVAVIHLETMDSLVFTIRTKEREKFRFPPATGAEHKCRLNGVEQRPAKGGVIVKARELRDCEGLTDHFAEVLHDVLFYFVGLFPGERNSRRGFSFKGGKCPWQINLSILWKIFPLFPSPLGTVLAWHFPRHSAWIIIICLIIKF